MIERLQRALEPIEELSPEAQADLAQQIEDMTAPLQDSADLPDLPDLPEIPADEASPSSVRIALALGGVWSDLQDDDEFAAAHGTP